MRITSHAPMMYLGMTAAGLLTLGFIGTYLYLMLDAGRGSILLYIFVTPFLLVGSLLAFFGGRTMLRLLWLGSWQLEVPGNGGVFGQPLRATLFPRRAVTPHGELQCRLRCVRFVSRQSSSRSSSSTTTLWEKSWTLPPAPIHPAIGLELSLPLPATGSPTAIDRQSGSGLIWQLNVLIPSAGSSEEPVFDIPVRH